MHCFQAKFQHKILNWLTLLSLFVPTYKEGRKEEAGTIRIVYKLRSRNLEVLHKQISALKYLKVKTPVVGSCFNKITRPVTVL